MTLLPDTVRTLMYWVLLILVLYAGLRWYEWRSLYLPSKKLRMDPSEAGLAFEEVTFVAEDDVRLHGWWIPHEQARGAVLVCHGNAGNIGDRIFMAEFFHALQLNVFLFDYRGFGKSKGIASERGTYRDARAAYELIRARYQHIDQAPVLVYGRSLGGAIALQLALDKPVRGLIIESSFTSVVDMSKLVLPWLPARYLVSQRYNSIGKIPELKVPLLMAHSREDGMIPFEQGQRLFEAAPDPKEFYMLSGGHNDAGWETSAEYRSALIDFVQRIFSKQ